MDDVSPLVDYRSTDLIDQLRVLIRGQNKAYKTEQTYVRWILGYLSYHNNAHPRELNASDIEKYLTWLAVERRVAPKTQGTALNSINFLYRQFLKIDIGVLDFTYTKTKPKLPVVFTHSECKSVLAQLGGRNLLCAELMYGSGLRVIECVRLRLKDIDFGMNEIIVRQGKGAKDRRTLLPNNLRTKLEKQVQGFRNFSGTTSQSDSHLSTCLTHSTENTPEQALNWHGSTCFQQGIHLLIQEQTFTAATMFPTGLFKQPSVQL